MTPEQHNKYLAYSHIGYGAFFIVLMVAMVIFIGAVLSFDPNTPPFLVFFLCTFLVAIYGAMSVPSFVAGYGLLKKKKWAKLWSIIAGVVAAMPVLVPRNLTRHPAARKVVIAARRAALDQKVAIRSLSPRP